MQSGTVQFSSMPSSSSSDRCALDCVRCKNLVLLLLLLLLTLRYVRTLLDIVYSFLVPPPTATLPFELLFFFGSRSK